MATLSCYSQNGDVHHRMSFSLSRINAFSIPALHVLLRPNVLRCIRHYSGNSMPKSQGGKSKKAQSQGAESIDNKQKDENKPVSTRPDNSIVIRVLAKPGAKQNGISGLTEDSVGVQIAAPPVEGEANTELIKYIAKTLGIRKSDVSLDQGCKSRTKVLLLDKNCGLSVNAVIAKLQAETES